MINYKEIEINIEDIYKELLKEKYSFIVIKIKEDNYILTKEKSLFRVENINKFIKESEKDIYYKTLVDDICKKDINKKDLNLYRKYIKKYRNKIEKNTYGDKYIFGSIAVKTDNNSFITTIRGKENLNEYTIVNYVDHINNLVNVNSKKATLNAPLLDNLFKNKKVKVIVHINHQYDKDLEYYDYAFPGTKRDSKRNNKTSFNIKNHGVFYLFDEENNIL